MPHHFCHECSTGSNLNSQICSEIGYPIAMPIETLIVILNEFYIWSRNRNTIKIRAFFQAVIFLWYQTEIFIKFYARERVALSIVFNRIKNKKGNKTLIQNKKKILRKL